MTAPAAPVSVRRVRADSAEAMQALGAALGREARADEVIALQGDLGAGKTCLVQGLARGLEVRGPVTSPTFIMIGEHPGRLRLYHVDLYRTSSLEEIRGLGLEELMDAGGVTVIEWAERAEGLLPARAIRIRIEGVGDEPREVTIEGLPPGWRGVTA